MASLLRQAVDEATCRAITEMSFPCCGITIYGGQSRQFETSFVRMRMLAGGPIFLLFLVNPRRATPTHRFESFMYNSLATSSTELTSLLPQNAIRECEAKASLSRHCDRSILSFAFYFLTTLGVNRLIRAKSFVHWSDCAMCPTTKHNGRVYYRLSDPQHRGHPTIAIVRSAAWLSALLLRMADRGNNATLLCMHCISLVHPPSLHRSFLSSFLQ